jgi:hypothetical protein
MAEGWRDPNIGADTATVLANGSKRQFQTFRAQPSRT